VRGMEQIEAGLVGVTLLPFHTYAIGSAILTTPGTLLGGAARSFVGRRCTNLNFWALVWGTQGMSFLPFVPVREDAK
jgi:hypothetical protein